MLAILGPQQLWVGSDSGEEAWRYELPERPVKQAAVVIGQHRVGVLRFIYNRSTKTSFGNPPF